MSYLPFAVPIMLYGATVARKRARAFYGMTADKVPLPANDGESQKISLHGQPLKRIQHRLSRAILKRFT